MRDARILWRSVHLDVRLAEHLNLPVRSDVHDVAQRSFDIRGIAPGRIPDRPDVLNLPIRVPVVEWAGQA
ncbi:MAG: hypothetical protein GEU73_12220 [Chloroflexi bacterium]|nr:hypothetical protein [Chloroflexota bacterium]